MNIKGNATCVCVFLILGFVHSRDRIKIELTPKSQHIAKVDKGQFWFVTGIHEACLHTTITVPSTDIKEIYVKAFIGISMFKVTHYVQRAFCQYINETEALNLSSDHVSFVGCTRHLHQNITPQTEFIASKTLEIKMKTRPGHPKKWLREMHDLGQETHVNFVGIVHNTMEKLCFNKTIKGYCTINCQQTCMDLILDVDRFSCDNKWGMIEDAKYLGSGSSDFIDGYVSKISPYIETERDGTLFLKSSSNLIDHFASNTTQSSTTLLEETHIYSTYGKGGAYSVCLQNIHYTLVVIFSFFMRSFY